jgi:hypothetical protein
MLLLLQQGSTDGGAAEILENCTATEKNKAIIHLILLK